MKEIHETAKIYEPVTILDAPNRKITIGKNCRIGQFCFIAARNFLMEEGVQVSPQVTIGGGGDVTLKKFSVVSSGAKLIPATDTPEGNYMCDSKSELERAVIRGSITVGEGAYIGANAVICVCKEYPNIQIGDFAVIGALSYIDGNILANRIVHPRQTLYVKARKRSITPE